MWEITRDRLLQMNGGRLDAARLTGAELNNLKHTQTQSEEKLSGIMVKRVSFPDEIQQNGHLPHRRKVSSKSGGRSRNNSDRREGAVELRPEVMRTRQARKISEEAAQEGK